MRKQSRDLPGLSHLQKQKGSSSENLLINTSEDLLSQPKVRIASESLAERALHSSQEQLQKLKQSVPRDEIVKYKELGLQILDFKRESLDEKKEDI